MAIVIAGIIGGVVAGVGGIIANYDDHSDHSDYSDYEVKRRQAEEEARKREEEIRRQRVMEARIYFNEVIRRNVSSFENREGVKLELESPLTSDACSFSDFEQDMKPLDDAAKKAIKTQVAKDLLDSIEEDERKLKELDSLIQAVNERILTNPKKSGNADV